MPPDPARAPDRCPGCGAANNCAISASAPAADCWCMNTSGPARPVPAAGACYCAACLRQLPREATP